MSSVPTLSLIKFLCGNQTICFFTQSSSVAEFGNRSADIYNAPQ